MESKAGPRLDPVERSELRRLQHRSEKSQAGGYASLGTTGIVPLAELPATMPPSPHTHVAGEITVVQDNSVLGAETGEVVHAEHKLGTGVIYASGNLERAAISGDVSIPLASNTATISNNAVSLAKMADVATDRLLGRDTAGTGDPEALTVGGGVEFTGSGGIQRSALTGDVTASAGSGATTIANDAVTNAKMANVATSTIKGRSTAGTGDPEDLSVASVRLLLAVPFVQWTETGDPVRTVGASSVVEETVVSATVPDDYSTTSAVWMLMVWGDFLQNSGAGNNSRLRIKLSDGTTTTTVFDKTNSFGNSSGRRGLIFRIFIVPRGATNKQRITGEMYLSQALNATAGFGDWGAFAATHGGLDSGDSTIDMAAGVDLTLSVTHQWDVSHASSYIRVYGSKLIYYP